MDPTLSLGVLHRAYRAVSDKTVAHLGLSQTAAWAQVMIGREGNGARHGVVADLLGVEGPSLVRTVDMLVAAGLVERREDAADRRARTLHLTAGGAAMQVKIEAALHELRAELFRSISDDDVAACLRLFSTLGGALGRPPLPRAQAREFGR